MRKAKRYMLAAVMGTMVSSAAFAVDPTDSTRTDSTRTDAPRTADLHGTIETPKSLPAGFATKDLNDQQDERAVLAAATNAAMTKHGFDDLIERLSTPDRKRIGDFAKQDFSELDGRIDQ